MGDILLRASGRNASTAWNMLFQKRTVMNIISNLAAQYTLDKKYCVLKKKQKKTKGKDNMDVQRTQYE